MAFSGLLLAGSAVTFMGFAPVAGVCAVDGVPGHWCGVYGPSIQAAVSGCDWYCRSGGQVLAVYQMKRRTKTDYFRAMRKSRYGELVKPHR